MVRNLERRHGIRLTLPAELGGPGPGGHQVHLLDLSPEGARVEHVHPFPNGHVCFLDLPPTLGGARLQGEVIWSQEARRQEVAEGDWRVFFQSGLRFTALTDGQRAGLTTALELLRASQDG